MGIETDGKGTEGTEGLKLKNNGPILKEKGAKGLRLRVAEVCG